MRGVERMCETNPISPAGARPGGQGPWSQPYKQSQFAADGPGRPSPRACPERRERAGGLDAATHHGGHGAKQSQFPRRGRVGTRSQGRGTRGNGAKQSQFRGLVQFRSLCGHSHGRDGWHRQRVAQGGLFRGIGVPPMLHGRDAHATQARSSGSGCYPKLNQANSVRGSKASSAFWEKSYGGLDMPARQNKQSQFPRGGPGGTRPQGRGTQGNRAKQTQFRWPARSRGDEGRGLPRETKPIWEEVSNVKCKVLSVKSGKPGDEPSQSSYFELYASNFRRNADWPERIVQNEPNLQELAAGRGGSIVRNKPNFARPHRRPGPLGSQECRTNPIWKGQQGLGACRARQGQIGRRAGYPHYSIVPGPDPWSFSRGVLGQLPTAFRSISPGAVRNRNRENRSGHSG
jgi:hypothetical protein